MTYNTIYNDPLERHRVTFSHVWWNDAFNDEEIVSIEQICDNDELEKAVTVGEDINNVRVSKVKFFQKNTKTDWIFDRFNQIAKNLNDQFYNFNLNGYKDFQYTVYNSDEQGKYDWHTDLIMDHKLPDNMWSSSTRKLSMVLLLSDPEKEFTGGEFQFNLGLESDPITSNFKRGMIIAFPSFLIHRVKPVLSGTRKSIVVWIEGPKFR